MWNYINMSASRVRLLQPSWWRHRLSGGNSDSLTAECVHSLKLSRLAVGGVSGPFRWKPPPCCGLEWHRVQEPKKNMILLATHPHDSVFRFKWPFLCCFIIKCAAFSGCRSIQITLKGPGERLHILYNRRQLTYTSLLQVRLLPLSVSQCWCAHISAARFNAMQNKQTKEKQQ